MKTGLNPVNQLINRVFYGWWMLAAIFVLLALTGGSYFFGFSVFFNAILEEFEWDRAATALAFSIASLEGGLESLVLGPLIDKYGPRKIMMVGVLLLGTGFFALSMINSMFTFYLVYMLFLGLGSNSANGVAPLAAVANWFIKRRTIAFGFLSAGYSVGGGVMVPLLGLLVEAFGWRASAVILCAITFLAGIPLVMTVRHKPEQYGYNPDGMSHEDAKELQGDRDAEDIHGVPEPRKNTFEPERDFTLKQALKTRSFWMLALSFAFRNLSLSSVIAHLVPLLVSRGFSAQTAANVLGLTAMMGTPGRLIFGFLGDMLPKRVLLVTAFGLQAIGLWLLMTASTLPQVYVFAAFMGMSWGSVPILFSLRAEYFGRTNFASVSGFMQAVNTPASFAGPVFAGLVFDRTQSYDIAFMVFMAACLVSMGLASLAAPPKAPSMPASDEPGEKIEGMELGKEAVP